jgi:hypothetical protein
MFNSTSSVTAGVLAGVLGGVLLGGGSSPDATVEAAAPSVTPTAGSASAATSPDGAIVMGAPSGASVDGWTEVGRTPVVDADGNSLADLSDLTAVYDRLLAIGTLDESPEGPSHQVVLTSTDGLTWVPVEVPGTDPVVTDLAATSNGLLAGGSVMDGDERRGNLWTSLDGLTWTSEATPPFAEVQRIVSAEAPLVVTAAGRRPSVWVNVGDDDWTASRRVNDFSIARGPGGFLMWRGGGQDRTVPTRLLHSVDAKDFKEVELPAALTKGDDAFAGVSVFALADRWVLVPSDVKLPHTIYPSVDGLTWEAAPRPTGMTEPVRGIAYVGDEAQAFGYGTPPEADPSELVPTPTALWAWQLGEAALEAAVLDPEGDDSIDAPVEFADGYTALGRDGGEDAHVTVWRYEPVTS